MAFAAALPFITTALGALGGLLGNRPSTTTQSGTSNTTGTQNTSGSSLITGSKGPAGDYLNSDLITKYLAMLNQDPDLSGYRAGGIGDINRLADVRNRNINETMAAHGISGPALGTSLINSENNRTGDITKFSQGIPLMAQQLNLGNLNAAGNFAAGLPESQMTNFNNTENSTQNTQQTGNVNQPGNMLGGLFGGAGNMLAYLYGNGAFGRNPTQTTNTIPSGRI